MEEYLNMCEVVRFRKNKGKQVVTPNPKFGKQGAHNAHTMVNVGQKQLLSPSSPDSCGLRANHDGLFEVLLNL
mgnify:CR=1 FL=1